MKLNESLRLMAGSFTLATLALSQLHHENWLWFTAFIGLNQLQSAFTKNCPAMFMLKKLGIEE
jgi:hypothetical protein